MPDESKRLNKEQVHPIRLMKQGRRRKTREKEMQSQEETTDTEGRKLHFLHSGSQGCRSQSQLSWAEGKVAAWTRCQFIALAAQRHKQPSALTYRQLRIFN